jgi:hypothetical protein
MPWDYVEVWEDGLRSLVYLERLLLRCSHFLTEGTSEDDFLIRTWLINPPPELKGVVIWTKAPANETVDTGAQRLVQWHCKEMRGGWHWQKAFEQIGEIDPGCFM